MLVARRSTGRGYKLIIVDYPMFFVAISAEWMEETLERFAF